MGTQLSTITQLQIKEIIEVLLGCVLSELDHKMTEISVNCITIYIWPT